jgi:hypothetical protein
MPAPTVVADPARNTLRDVDPETKESMPLPLYSAIPLVQPAADGK